MVLVLVLVRVLNRYSVRSNRGDYGVFSVKGPDELVMAKKKKNFSSGRRFQSQSTDDYLIIRRR